MTTRGRQVTRGRLRCTTDEQVDERSRGGEQEQRGQGGLGVGAGRGELPDLGRERLETDRTEEQRRRQLLHRGEEHERGARGMPGLASGRVTRSTSAAAAAEAAGRLFEIRAHRGERGARPGERLGEEADDVGEEQQPSVW